MPLSKYELPGVTQFATEVTVDNQALGNNAHVGFEIDEKAFGVYCDNSASCAIHFTADARIAIF